jgi:hypothetical protein
MKFLYILFLSILITYMVSADKCYSECEYQCSRDASDCLGQCALNSSLWNVKDPNKSDMAGCLGKCRVHERSCTRNCNK